MRGGLDYMDRADEWGEPRREGETAGEGVVRVGLSGFGSGPDEEAADVCVVGARSECGTGRGFTAVESAGGSGAGMG